MFGFLPHNLFTNHIGQNTSGLSPRLWSKISGTIMAGDGQKRLILAGDDFVQFQGLSAVASSAALVLPAATVTVAGGASIVTGYQCYVDIGGNVERLETDPGGVVHFVAGNAADEVAIIGSGNLGSLDDPEGSGTARKTAFECRIKLNTVAEGSMFVGLASNELKAVNGLIASNGSPIAAGAHIGFSVNEADLDGIDFTYQEKTLAEQRIATVQTAAADTWYKLGFIYDPDEVAAKRITVYVDNEEQTTYVTKTLIETSTFPDETMLGFAAASMAGNAAADNDLEIDWWAYAQLID